MTNQNVTSPIKLEINANCFLMGGRHGILDFWFTNRVGDKSFEVELRLHSHILAVPVHRRLHVKEGGDATRSVDLEIKRGDATGPSVVGRMPVEIELVIDGANEGQLLFKSEVVLTILPYADSRQEVDANIVSLAQHSGSESGTAGINEIDLDNMLSVSIADSVVDMLSEKRSPRFVEINLAYEGLAREKGEVIERQIPRLTHCSLSRSPGDKSLLVWAGPSLKIGRKRTEADLVTWFMPPSDEASHKTRAIAGLHVELRFDSHHGPVVANHASKVPASLDAEPIDRHHPSPIPTEHLSVLELVKGFELVLSPLSFPDISEEMEEEWLTRKPTDVRRCWRWGREEGVGGYLIERTDELARRERYLWLLSVVVLPTWRGGSCKPLLASLPMIALGTADPSRRLAVTGESESSLKAHQLFPLKLDDGIEDDSEVGTHVRLWSQQLLENAH